LKWNTTTKALSRPFTCKKRGDIKSKAITTFLEKLWRLYMNKVLEQKVWKEIWWRNRWSWLDMEQMPRMWTPIYRLSQLWALHKTPLSLQKWEYYIAQMGKQGLIHLLVIKNEISKITRKRNLCLYFGYSRLQLGKNSKFSNKITRQIFHSDLFGDDNGTKKHLYGANVGKLLNFPRIIHNCVWEVSDTRAIQKVCSVTWRWLLLAILSTLLLWYSWCVDKFMCI